MNVLAKTQSECREKLKQAIQAAETLDLAKFEKLTVGAWMDLWMENYGKPGMRPTTYANYETLIRLHIKPYIGDILIGKLTSLDLQMLYNKLLTEGRVDRPEAKKLLWSDFSQRIRRSDVPCRGKSTRR